MGKGEINNACFLDFGRRISANRPEDQPSFRVSSRACRKDDLDFTSDRVFLSASFFFFFSHFFERSARELPRRRGRNFFTLIYFARISRYVRSRIVFFYTAAANSAGEIRSRREIRALLARSLARARKGLRVFPLSEAAIADITVTGILVGSRS